MKIIVFGGTGLLGWAITRALRRNGHDVITAGRSVCDAVVDFRHDNQPEAFASLVQGADIVVNAAGILIEHGDNTFDAVHVKAPTALFAACAKARVARIVHISSLGVGTGIRGAYMATKLAAETALKAGPVDFAIVRPALLVDDDCPTTQLFKFMATMPIIALPGLVHRGGRQLAPIHVQDVAQAVVQICQHPKALRRVIELAGPQTMSYRQMLTAYRHQGGKGAALWLPLPWWLMKLAALLAAKLPQKVFSIDSVRMLQAGSVADCNEATQWAQYPLTPFMDRAVTALQTPMGGATASGQYAGDRFDVLQESP
jgi:uncharacterized protein YbjT (DUF2867 family)